MNSFMLLLALPFVVGALLLIPRALFALLIERFFET